MSKYKEWYSASELAGKDGLAKNARNIRIRAKKEGWAIQKRGGRGGAFEYHISSLPLETQRALVPKNRIILFIKKTALTIFKWLRK